MGKEKGVRAVMKFGLVRLLPAGNNKISTINPASDGSGRTNIV